MCDKEWRLEGGGENVTQYVYDQTHKQLINEFIHITHIYLIGS